MGIRRPRLGFKYLLFLRRSEPGTPFPFQVAGSTKPRGRHLVFSTKDSSSVGRFSLASKRILTNNELDFVPHEHTGSFAIDISGSRSSANMSLWR